jgi:hypothetical protein
MESDRRLVVGSVKPVRHICVNDDLEGFVGDMPKYDVACRIAWNRAVASSMETKNMAKGKESVSRAYIPDVITRPSGNMRIISVTTGTRESSMSVLFSFVITPPPAGPMSAGPPTSVAILTCLKKRREVYIRIWVSLPITKDSSTDFLD